VIDLDALPDDVDSLKQLVTAAFAALKSKTLEIEKLKVQLRRLRRMQFGRSSEKLAGEIAQLELALEELEGSEAAAGEPPAAAAGAPAAGARIKPARRALPDHLPREAVIHAPPVACPACGGALRPLGEDSSEVLEYVPGHFKVIRHVRPKVSCRSCETIQQAPSPDLPIDRGRPGPGLLAHLLVNKYGAHLPLYRQAEIFARSGVDLGRSTLAGWVGQAAFVLRPLVDAIASHVLAADKIHGDDTTVPVLAPGTGRTKTGRLWVYVRDDRPWSGPAPPAAFYCYSPDRRAEHPLRHLTGFRGILQADGYAGFNELYRRNAVVEVACWAHVRRKFFDFHAATDSPLAAIALQRIGALYEIEDGLRGCPAEARRTGRTQRAGPLLDQLHAWLEATLPRISTKSELAVAIRYALKHWPQLTRYRDNGHLEIDNNAAERAIRPLTTARSLYPPSSSVCKHCKLVFGFDPTRATCSPDRGGYPFVLQIRGSDLVRSARHNLIGGEYAVLDQPSDAVVRDAERRSDFRHRQPLAVLLGGTVGVDAMHPPQRADTVRGPGLSLARGHSHSVQRRGDVFVRPSGRHAPHHGERLFGRPATMLAGLRLADPQLRVLAAAPMDRQDDLARRFIDVGDDVGDKRAEETLARAHGHARRIPCSVEIVGQPGEVGRRGSRIRRSHRLQPCLAGLDAMERRLPALLEPCGN